jgi:hypothetical protein
VEMTAPPCSVIVVSLRSAAEIRPGKAFSAARWRVMSVFGVLLLHCFSTVLDQPFGAVLKRTRPDPLSQATQDYLLNLVQLSFSIRFCRVMQIASR